MLEIVVMVYRLTLRHSLAIIPGTPVVLVLKAREFLSLEPNTQHGRS